MLKVSIPLLDTQSQPPTERLLNSFEQFNLRSNFLTLVYNSHLQNILVVHRRFVHQFSSNPTLKNPMDSNREIERATAIYPPIGIFFVQILRRSRNGSVTHRA